MNSSINMIDCPDFIHTSLIEAQKLKEIAHKNADAFLIFQYSKIKEALSGAFMITQKYAKSLGISRERYRAAFKVLVQFGLAQKQRPEHKKDGTFKGGAYTINRPTESRTPEQLSIDLEHRDTDFRTPVFNQSDFSERPPEIKATDDKALVPMYGIPSVNKPRDKPRDRDTLKDIIPLPLSVQKLDNTPVAMIPLARGKFFEVSKAYCQTLKSRYPNVLVEDQLMLLINWLADAQELRTRKGAIHAIDNFLKNASTDFGKNKKESWGKKNLGPQSPNSAPSWPNSINDSPLDLSIPSFG